MVKKAKDDRRGGLRSPHGGRPTRYPGKIKKTWSIQLTEAAAARLAADVATTGASESDIVCNRLIESKVKNLPPLGDAG